MGIESLRRIHCVGIGGIGVSAIARYCASHGARVSGSDVASSVLIERLKEEGMEIAIGHHDENFNQDVQLLIYSDAVPQDNPERKKAESLSIPQMSYAEVLGEISRTRPTIAITGMHGKSTTTAMMGLVCVEAGLDPLVIVGSQVPQFEGSNIRLSSSGLSPFIVEADEYRGHMNFLSPTLIIITNIEEEHLDFYHDIDHIRETFQTFVNRLPKNGILIRQKDDAALHPLFTKCKEHYYDDSVVDTAGITLRVPGTHNRENASGVLKAARAWGIDDVPIKRGLEQFHGIWRRFELLGAYDDVDVISDYGHHPTEINATLAATREAYAGKKILLVFQPHQYDRTSKLFSAFVNALSKWDGVVVCDVFDVPGREENRTVGSEQLYEALKQNGARAWYGGSLHETEKTARQLIGEFDVAVIMGAGSIDGMARKIVKQTHVEQC